MMTAQTISYIGDVHVVKRITNQGETMHKLTLFMLVDLLAKGVLFFVVVQEYRGTSVEANLFTSIEAGA